MKKKLILSFIIIVIFSGCVNQPKNLAELKNVQSLIGLHINSNSIQNYLNALREDPEITKYDDCSYYVFSDGGIDFRFSNNDTLTTVWLFTKDGKYDTHNNQFEGEIPFKVLLTDNRKKIEQKLGPPKEKDMGIVLFACEWNIEDFQFEVTYKTEDKEDMNNEVNYFRIMK